MESARTLSRVMAFDDRLPQSEYSIKEHLRFTEMSSMPGKLMQASQVVVEVQRYLGGMHWCALLGGSWTPDSKAPFTTIDVAVADASLLSGDVGFPGLLGKSYQAGLITEFSPHVSSGFCEVVRESSCGPGIFHVDHAGFDKESSSVIFRHAGRMLARILIALSSGEDPLITGIRELRSW